MCSILSFCGHVMAIFILWRWRQHLDLYGRQVLHCLPLHQTKRMCRRRPVHPHDQHLLLWGLFFRAPTNLLASGLLPLAGCWEGKTQADHGIFFKVMIWGCWLVTWCRWNQRPALWSICWWLFGFRCMPRSSPIAMLHACWPGEDGLGERKRCQAFFWNGYQCYQHRFFR